MAKKLAIEYILELDPAPRANAIRSIRDQGYESRLLLECENAQAALSGSFSWVNTIEGAQYWIDIHSSLTTS